MKQIAFPTALLLLSLITLVKAQDVARQKVLVAKDDSVKIMNRIYHAIDLLNVDTRKAEAEFKNIVALSKKLKFYYAVGNVRMNIGNIENRAGNYKQALLSYRKAITAFNKINKINGVAMCLGNIGLVHEALGNMDSTLIYYLRAARDLESVKNYHSLGILFNNIGIVHYNMQNYGKAIDYHYEAINIGQKHQDTTVLIKAYTELSTTYSSLKQHKKAANLAYKGLALANVEKKPTDLARVYSTLATSQLDQNKTDSAIFSANKAVYYSLLIDDIGKYLASALVLAEGYRLKQDHQKRYSVLKTALGKCINTGNITYQSDLYKPLAEASYQLGKYQEAYNYYAKSTELKDGFFNEKNRNAVAELEIKYQTAKKEKELSQKQLQLAQKDLQLQKVWQYTFISIATALVAFLIASLIFLYFRHKRKLHDRQLQAVQHEKEIQVLQALMQGEEKERSRIAKDLHDGVAGMLAATKMHVSTLALQNENLSEAKSYQQTITLLDEASREVRKTAHNLMPEMLMQHGLDEALRRYCENISNEKALVVQYDSWGEIKRYKDSFELSVYRIVQELLNNIMKHSKADRAIVQVSQNNNILSTTIEDNGIGFNKQEMKTEGLGLRSLQSRVQAINGKLEVEAEAGSGVSAYLEFETSGLEV